MDGWNLEGYTSVDRKIAAIDLMRAFFEHTVTGVSNHLLYHQKSCTYQQREISTFSQIRVGIMQKCS